MSLGNENNQNPNEQVSAPVQGQTPQQQDSVEVTPTEVEPTETPQPQTEEVKFSEAGLREDKLQSLYNTITNRGYNIGTYEQYYEKMNESRFRRQKFHSFMSSKLNIGTFEEMEGTLMPTPDDDYDASDPAFDRYGHKRFDSAFRPMRTSYENIRTTQEIMKDYDGEYQSKLSENIKEFGEEDGKQKTEDWYED